MMALRFLTWYDVVDTVFLYSIGLHCCGTGTPRREASLFGKRQAVSNDSTFAMI